MERALSKTMHLKCRLVAGAVEKVRIDPSWTRFCLFSKIGLPEGRVNDAISSAVKRGYDSPELGGDLKNVGEIRLQD